MLLGYGCPGRYGPFGIFAERLFSDNGEKNGKNTINVEKTSRNPCARLKHSVRCTCTSGFRKLFSHRGGRRRRVNGRFSLFRVPLPRTPTEIDARHAFTTAKAVVFKIYTRDRRISRTCSTTILLCFVTKKSKPSRVEKKPERVGEKKRNTY